MPIPIDTTVVQPPPPESETSSDGILTVHSDNGNAGVLLYADFSALVPTPTRVRFFRDGLPVRSGDAAWTSDGHAVAYDHEVPLGTSSSWWATPVNADGTDGAPSAAASLTVPWIGNPSEVWLKSLLDPDTSMRLVAATFEEQGRPTRTTQTPILGASLDAGSWDVTGGLAATLSLKTDTREQYEALTELLNGQPLLLQAHPEDAGIPANLYIQPVSDIAAARRVETGFGWAKRLWPVQLVEVQRPTTVDSPLIIPGLSWETVAAQYASWDALAAAYPGGWLSLLGA